MVRSRKAIPAILTVRSDVRASPALKTAPCGQILNISSLGHLCTLSRRYTTRRPALSLINSGLTGH